MMDDRTQERIEKIEAKVNKILELLGMSSEQHEDNDDFWTLTEFRLPYLYEERSFGTWPRLEEAIHQAVEIINTWQDTSRHEFRRWRESFDDVFEEVNERHQRRDESGWDSDDSERKIG